MRVLMVTEASSAGVGRHVIDLCTALVDHGDEVHLVHATGRTDAAFAEGLTSLGDRVRQRVIEMRRAPHASDVRALRELRAYVKEHGPFDVTHGQSSKGGALARLVRSEGTGVVVYTPHCVYTLNPSVRGIKRFVFGRAERWLARHTHAVIAVSPTEAQHLEDLGFRPEIVHCVPNGIADTDWMDKKDARSRLGLPEDALIVGFLARMSPQKNPLLMIEAFAAIADQHPQARLAMAGTGDLEDAARRRASELRVSDRVHWLGYQRPADFLPCADLFALSSDYEGMPYVYLEALSCGLPIVTTDVGGSELAIEDGRNGSIVPRGDHNGLGAALARVLVDPDLRHRMSAAARERAREFSLAKMLQRTQAVYQQACTGAQRARASCKP